MLSFTLRRGRGLINDVLKEKKNGGKGNKMQTDIKATYEEFSVSVEHVNHAEDESGHDAVPLRF